MPESASCQSNVEDELIGICRTVLRIDSVDAARSFADNGGDSFSTLLFVAEVLRRFGAAVSPETVLTTPSLAALAQTIATRRIESPPGDAPSPVIASLTEQLAPRQGLSVGPVRLLANRYSYFFKRRRNLEYWDVGTGFLTMRESLDVPALRSAIEALVVHHDGLRLQVTRRGGHCTESIVEPAQMDAFVSRTYRGTADGFRAFAGQELVRLYEGFTFPGPLFKVLHAGHQGGADLVAVLAHHLVVDAFSFALALDDVFELYRQFRLTGKGALPPKTTALRDFSDASTRYWLVRGDDEIRFWKSLPWARLVPWPAAMPRDEGANEERHTKYVIRSIPLDREDPLGRWLAQVQGSPLLATLVCAIARAFRAWTGHDVLHLATVFHGRDAFLDSVDLSRTIGWISETVPVVIDARPSIAQVLSETLELTSYLSRHGRSYGVLKYLAPPEVRTQMAGDPEPAVSLNVVMRQRPGSAYRDVAFKDPGYPVPPPNKPSTERAFILSGGAYMRDGSFHLSWDFSDRVLAPSAVERFADLCLEELTACLRHHRSSR